MTLHEISDELNELIQKRLEDGDASALLGRPYFLLNQLQKLLCNSPEAMQAQNKYGIGTYCYMEVEGSPTFEIFASATDKNPYYILRSRGNSVRRTLFTIKRKKRKNIGGSGLCGLVPDRAILNESFDPKTSVDGFYCLVAQTIAKNNQPLLQAIQCIDSYAKELGQDRLNELNRAFCSVRESTQLNTMLPLDPKRIDNILWNESVFNPELRERLIMLNEEETK